MTRPCWELFGYFPRAYHGLREEQYRYMIFLNCSLIHWRNTRSIPYFHHWHIPSSSCDRWRTGTQNREDCLLMYPASVGFLSVPPEFPCCRLCPGQHSYNRQIHRTLFLPPVCYPASRASRYFYEAAGRYGYKREHYWDYYWRIHRVYPDRPDE